MKNEIKESIRRLERYLPLVRELVIRDLKLKYRRSVLGYIWSLLNPLLMMAVMTLIFSYMFRFDIPNYPLYLICGQTLFSFFNEATNMSMYSIIQNGTLIKKVYVPKYIFPVSRVASSFVTMLFSLIAIIIVMIATRTTFHFSVLLFWVPLVYLFIFSCGIGMILAAFAVQFRDITHLYSVVTMAWMYLTPIFYPITSVPSEVAGVIAYNPLYNFITIFRELVLYGNIPPFATWASGVISSVAIFVIGVFVFRKMQKNFILYI
ncbi:MAG: ABC transporter permease [Clostridia bacterium]|nr:ABC transporter permease [Clostridia bacterium]